MKKILDILLYILITPAALWIFILYLIFGKQLRITTENALKRLKRLNEKL